MIDLNSLQTFVHDYMNGIVPPDCSKRDSDRFKRTGGSHERLDLTDEIHLEKFYRWRGRYLLHQPTAIAVGERFLVIRGYHPVPLNTPQGQQLLETIIFEISQNTKFDTFPFWNSFFTMEMNEDLVEELEKYRKKMNLSTKKKATLF